MQCVYQAMTAHLLGHRIACRHVLRYMEGGLDSFDVVHRPSAVTNPGPRTEKKDFRCGGKRRSGAGRRGAKCVIGDGKVG